MSLFKKKDKAEPHVYSDADLGIDTTGMTEDEIAAARAEAVLQRFDRESSFRNKLNKPLTMFISIILIAFAVFQLYTTISPIPSQLLRAYHVAFVLFLTFLLFPATKGMRKDRIPWYDFVLALLALAVTLYIPFNYAYLVKNIGNYRLIEVIIGVVGILLVMEACRRTVGLPILIIVSCFLLYAVFGKYIPGSFGHRGYTIRQLSTHMYYTIEGVFGTPIGVSATFIFLFILFGAFLEKTGVGKLFIDLANALAGKRVGGPAKVAVISSALQGTVSGSSVANTVGTGSFTIPAMKKLGYKPEFAGAVEAAASTGGQLMPPIMGAAAFLMSEVTGFAYSKIVLAAIVPAILYFSGILISVHHEAKKLGLRGMEAKDIIPIGKIMRERSHLLIPLAFMIFVLASGKTPAYAALGAILTALMAHSIGLFTLIPTAWLCIGLLIDPLFNALGIGWIALIAIGLWLVVCAIRYFVNGKFLGFNPIEILDALKNGARSVLSVAVACAMAGMIVGTVTLTGLGLKLATGLARVASLPLFQTLGIELYILMFFTMLASIVLGMGVPTTANYLITSTICAPALMSMLVARAGLSEATMAITLSAHLFVFYFGIIADITPPVALAAMAGSAIAKGEPFKTGVTATRIAIGAFLVPYLFVLNPAMLMIDTNFFEVALIIVSALLGMYAFSGGLAGFVQDKNKWYETILLLIGGLGMLIPGWQTDLLGLVLVSVVLVLQNLRIKKRGKLTAAV